MTQDISRRAVLAGLTIAGASPMFAQNLPTNQKHRSATSLMVGSGQSPANIGAFLAQDDKAHYHRGGIICRDIIRFPLPLGEVVGPDEGELLGEVVGPVDGTGVGPPVGPPVG